jgi:hypothetical protein
MKVKSDLEGLFKKGSQDRSDKPGRVLSGPQIQLSPGVAPAYLYTGATMPATAFTPLALIFNRLDQPNQRLFFSDRNDTPGHQGKLQI